MANDYQFKIDDRQFKKQMKKLQEIIRNLQK